jgi:amino acid permease
MSTQYHSEQDMAMHSGEQEPLLSRTITPTDSTKDDTSSDESATTIAEGTSRKIEDDVLPETSTLGRTISWSSAYILVISRVIGSGIFATPGVIVKDVGSVGLSLTLWVVGAIIAACGLAVGLEYGCMLPRSGGEKVYLEFVYRRPRFLASTLVATQAVLLGFTASNCIVFAQYTLYAFDVEATDFRRKSLAVGLLTAITIIHSCFMKTGIRIQNFLGWIKIGLVVFMIFAGLFVVAFQGRGGHGKKSQFPAGPEFWQGSDWSWGIISTSLFKVFYSFAGLTNVNNVSQLPAYVDELIRAGHERSPEPDTNAEDGIDNRTDHSMCYVFAGQRCLLHCRAFGRHQEQP